MAYVHIHNPKRGIRIHVTPFSCSYSNEVAIIHLNIVVLVCREFRASLPEHCSVLSDAFPWFNPSNVSHATSNRTGQIQTILSALFCSVIFCVLNDLKILFFRLYTRCHEDMNEGSHYGGKLDSGDQTISDFAIFA